MSVRMVESLIARQGIPRERVRGLGVGVPGPMQQAESGRGYVVNPKLFPGWHRIPFADWLHERLHMPVFLENNATAAAIGERWYGSGRQIDSFFYVFFGSELGGGLLLNGQPYEGFTGNAGEIGYLPAALARDDGNPDRGHVGMHFNLLRLYERLRAQGIETRAPADLDGLYADGHSALLAWMDTGADLLAGILLAVEYILDPEAIVYGGRLSDAILRGLMDRVAERLGARRISEKTRAPRYLAATAGVDAAALGVATLPIYQFFAPAPKVLLKQGRGSVTRASRRAG